MELAAGPVPGPHLRHRDRPASRRRLLRAVTAVCAALGAAAPAIAAGDAAPAFKVYLSDPGVYRVSYEDLREAGLEAGEVDSSGLAAGNRGEAVPIWVADGGDGRFGPGDHVELVGEHLPGHRSYYNEHTPLNVYRLELGQGSGLRMSAPEAVTRPAPLRPLPVATHEEKDGFMVRFSGWGGDAPEPWYWERLTHVDPEPFRNDFWLHLYRPNRFRNLSIKVHLHGWSVAGGSLPDHRVEVLLNGRQVGAGEWDGEEAHLIEIPRVPMDLPRGGANRLELRVPQRRPDSPSSDPVIDAVILNWIEIEYPRQPRIESEQVGFTLPTPAYGRPIRLLGDAGERLRVYGSGGARFDRGNLRVSEFGDATAYDLAPPVGETRLFAVPSDAFLSPTAVELDHPSSLRDPGRQADYVIVTHPRLRQAIEPLAELHRRRGLAVTVVEVDDVYDEFNHSILHPDAIRDFLSYAYHHWRAPAPRFVLLVGDASWAGRSGWSPPGEVELATRGDKLFRNLIPAGVYEGFQGPAASDNFFVSVAGDDDLPDMAIGRLPVIEPEDVTAIVDKTVSYAAAAGVGPWRRSILWITNNEETFQERSDDVAAAASRRGFAALKVYPSPDDSDNDRHQEVLRQAFGQGQLLVHFYGHGGRFIWRTGNMDTRERRDLFTLDHLDQLAPAVNLPLVLSMTCYSAPFDHPTDDSIGEKFLRLPDRGAIAVLAASWRVPPVIKFSQILVEELTSPGTIGEAVMRAKHRMRSRSLVEMYNLLGDPAVELALPKYPLEVVARADGESGWRIAAAVPHDIAAGHAIVDWLDDAGGVVKSDSLEVTDATLEAEFGGSEAVAAVRVYVWDEDAGVDGLGAAELPAGQG